MPSEMLDMVCNFDPTIHKRLEGGLEALPDHGI